MSEPTPDLLDRLFASAHEAVGRLQALGSELNRGGHPANVAEQIWDQCDILAFYFTQAKLAALAADRRGAAPQETGLTIVGECRNGAPHYCPNCDNSFTAIRPAGGTPHEEPPARSDD